MRFTPYGEPSDREIDAQRLPPYCPQCEEPTNNYDELCQDCQDMNPHSTHPSQDQDGLDSAFTASTAELFKPLPTIEDISIDFSLKDGEAKKERVLAILKFMKKLSDFEKRSTKRNLLVGLKKG